MLRMPAVTATQQQEPRRKTHFVYAVVGLILFILLLMRSAAAQGIQQFVGHVADSSGAAIPGATVTIHNEGTGEDILVKTTGTGDYTVPYLKPGTYTITAMMAGFKEISKIHINLDVDQTSKLDFALPPGNVSETVTVSAEEAQIELAKADRGEIIDGQRVSETALDGRQAIDLVDLSPGILMSNSPQYIRMQDNTSQNLQANGVSVNAIAENIDGSTNDNAGNYMGYNAPLDAIGEFKVVLNAYDASYGRSAGSAVDISLKEGTNKVHGAVYEYARRPYLDANSWAYNYNPTGIRPAHKRDQFGAELDGPVFIPHFYNGRDKTFFLLDWEQSYENSPSTSPTINSIPNPAWLQGNFAGAQFWDSTTQSLMSDIIYDPLSPLVSFVDVDGKTKMKHSPFPGNVIPQTCSPVPPATACSSLNGLGQALGQYYSGITPNYNPGGGYAPWTNNYYWIQTQDFVSRDGTAKITHVFGDHDRATIRWGGIEFYNVTNPNGIPASDPANYLVSQVQPKGMQFQLEEIHTFTPNLLLDNKVVVSTYKQGLTYGSRGNYLGPLGFSQNVISNSYVKNMIPYVSTTQNLGGNSFIALSSNTPGRHNISHELGYAPSSTYIKGRHTIRVGADVRFLQYTTTQPNGNNQPNLQFNFTATWTGELGPGYAYAPGLTAGNPIASMVLGDPSTGSNGFQPSPFWSQHYRAFWAQDDWKLTSKLTLNVGVRYDLLGARTERHNTMNGPFDFSDMNPYGTVGGITFAGVNGVPRGVYSMSLLNIQPRFGAAYAFSPRTSLRLGFGEFFVSDESANVSVGYSATTSYNNSLNAGVTPYGHLSDPFPVYIQPTGSSLGLATNIGNGQSFTDPNMLIPQIWNSSVSVEQLLTRRDTLEITYSSTRGYNLPGSNDLNHYSPTLTAMCDADRGAPNGNRVKYCDGSSAPAQQPNPFSGIAAFSGTTIGNNATVSALNLSRPLIAFGSITENNLPLVHSWYNSMQVVAAHNASKDLTFHAALTWSKNMSAGNIIDTVNQVVGRSLQSNDTPIALTLSGVWYIPVGRGQHLLGHTSRLVDAAVGGWELSPLYVYHQGVPWSPGSNFIIMQNLHVNQHDLPFDSSHSYKRLQGVNPCVGYEDEDIPGLIHQGPAYTNNNCTSYAAIRTASSYSVARNIVYTGVRLPASHQFDASISKRFRWNERANFQARLDVLNVLNHPNWSQNGGTGANSYSNDPTNANWGTISKGPSGPENFARELQISGKFNF